MVLKILELGPQVAGMLNTLAYSSTRTYQYWLRSGIFVRLLAWPNGDTLLCYLLLLHTGAFLFHGTSWNGTENYPISRNSAERTSYCTKTISSLVPSPPIRWPRVIILNRSISFPFHFHFRSGISFPHLALACCVIVREDVFSACHCLAAFAAFNVCSAIMG